MVHLKREFPLFLCGSGDRKKLSTSAISGPGETAIGIYFRSQLLTCTVISSFVLLRSRRELFGVVYHSRGRQSGLEETGDSFNWIAWILKSYFLS